MGLDNSPVRIERAVAANEAAGVEFPLHAASAESTPFADASFDIVMCDWGAMSFADPFVVVPEVARIMRSGGLFAFSGATPLSWVCWSEDPDEITETLLRDWFGMHRWPTPEGAVEFNLSHGDWIDLFRKSGMAIERLIEVQPPEGAKSPYRTEAETAWARRWPMEQIWKLRRE